MIVAEDLMLTREGIVRLLAEAGIDVIAQVADGTSPARASSRSRSLTR